MRAFIEAVGQAAREAARQEAEAMVTEALQAVFGPRLRFRVELTEQRGRPDAEFTVESAGFAADPLDAHGGGVVDVLSLALRLLLLESAQPRIEGAALARRARQARVGGLRAAPSAFLATASREFGRQVILVTHNEELAAVGERAYRVELDGDASRVAEAKG